jgi:hypothetical protein
MVEPPRTALEGWTDEQIAQARRWIATWQRAGVALERQRVREIRSLDTYRAISLLLGPGIPLVPPRPSSGLVDQQRWFMRIARHS